MRIVYKILLTINSTILILFLYIVKGEVFLFKNDKIISISLYIVFICIYTFLCLHFMKFLTCDSIEGGITEISLANDAYMPSYLGYFFVALSIPDKDWITFWIVFLIINVFTFFSKSLYYNPLFLLFRYQFYYVSTEKQMKILIISKAKDIRGTDNLVFNNLRRISNFTFLDKEKY